MERGLILLVAALMVFLSAGVHVTPHVSFSNDTQLNITRLYCGMVFLCLSTPDDCDPAGNKKCLFAAEYSYVTEPPNGTKLAFLLRGDSAGYVALGLTVDPTMGNTMLFICAKNSSDNGTFVFQTMDRNNKNNKLTPTERRVIDLHGRVTGNVIECGFIVPNVNASSVKSSHDSTFYILLGTGTVDGDTFGPFNISLNSGPKDLYKPPIPPIIIPTFKPMSTDNSSGAVQPRAALLLLSVLTLSVLLRA